MPRTTIYRSRGQVIYRFLPGCLVDFLDGTLVARVSKWNSSRLTLPGGRRLLEKVYSLFPRYLGIDHSFPENPDLDRFAFFEPNTIELELFPLTVYLRETNEYFQFTSPYELENFLKTRHAVKAEFRQTDLVLVSDKGGISSLQLPRCPQHNRDRIILDKRGESQRSFIWTCGICHTDLGRIEGWVDGEKIMKAEPVRAAVTYLPQTVTMVNVRGDLEQKGDRLVVDCMVLARYLGLLEQSDLETAIEEAGKAPRIPTDKELREIARNKFGTDDKEFLEKFRSAYAELQPNKKYAQIMASIEHTFADSGLRESLAAVTYEYLETLREGAISLAELCKQSKENARLHEFNRALSLIGIENAHYIERVPLIAAAYGYCRGSIDPKDMLLRAFPADAMDKSKIPIYVDITRSEGIMLDLNRQAIVKWLRDNGVITETPSPESLRSWFFNNVKLDQIRTFSGVMEEGITKNVFGLMHTISHALHKKISVPSGLGVDSVGELLFPNIPAILLYSHEAAGFSTGGLKHLFMNELYSWVGLSLDWAKTCVYDPLCVNGPAACHHCLFTTEFSCSHFNQDLSRRYLFGRTDGEKQTIGFWDSALREFL